MEIDTKTVFYVESIDTESAQVFSDYVMANSVREATVQVRCVRGSIIVSVYTRAERFEYLISELRALQEVIADPDLAVSQWEEVKAGYGNES